MRDAGVVVDPSEVIITHGCVDALQMSLRVLTRPGDLIAAESPTYYGLLQLADLLGLKVIEMVGIGPAPFSRRQRGLCPCGNRRYSACLSRQR